MSTSRDSEPPAREFGTEGATADRTGAGRQCAHFELRVVAMDKPTTRRRWNGGPMASDEASAALFAGVEAFNAALRARGFTPASTGYGVHASAPSPLTAEPSISEVVDGPSA